MLFNNDKKKKKMKFVQKYEDMRLWIDVEGPHPTTGL